ncbi:MAG TPA: hypothetical protein VKD91_10200, partial [Pyrinomonadaceae bacterium]|nr:hypothetical protein [Pyrinomonadaceae bacterium]
MVIIYLTNALSGRLVNAEGVSKLGAQGNALGNEHQVLKGTLKEFANSTGVLIISQQPFQGWDESIP